MSLNPHPIVVTTASERRRTELLNLAGPKQPSCPALYQADHRLRFQITAGTQMASGILAMLFAAARQG
ncbi:MAG: hypothetical protein U0075_26450 [Thermomicrobiales bacterium]